MFFSKLQKTVSLKEGKVPAIFSFSAALLWVSFFSISSAQLSTAAQSANRLSSQLTCSFQSLSIVAGKVSLPIFFFFLWPPSLNPCSGEIIKREKERDIFKTGISFVSVFVLCCPLVVLVSMINVLFCFVTQQLNSVNCPLLVIVCLQQRHCLILTDWDKLCNRLQLCSQSLITNRDRQTDFDKHSPTQWKSSDNFAFLCLVFVHRDLSWA